MVNQKLGFITVAICFGYITTLTGLIGSRGIMLHVCCRLKRCLTEVQTTNVDMASEVAASSGRESHHLHCIQSLSAQTAKLQAENTELTGKVTGQFSPLITMMVLLVIRPRWSMHTSWTTPQSNIRPLLFLENNGLS